MRLFERKYLPESAGLATLVFDAVDEPVREEDTITLPNDQGVEFFSLLRGKQFLLRTDGGKDPGLWFGGTDEQPFLVRLNPEALGPLVHNGHEAFFESLIPSEIRKRRAQFGADKVRRQGDIFAWDLETEWWDFFTRHNNTSIRPAVVEEASLFDTRHMLTGKQALLQRDNLSFLVAEGKIEAPDHKSIVLRGPHLMGQTANLYDPPNAD